MKFNVERKVLAGLIAVLLLMAGIGLDSYFSINQLVENTRRAADSLKVRRGAQSLLLTMLNLETGTRGYVITGEKSYLEPYQNAVDQVGQQMTGLSQAISNAPEQQQQFTKLANLVTAELAIEKSHVEQRQKQDLESASREFETGSGKREMDQIREAVGEIVANQDELISQQDKRGAQQARQTIWTIGIGSVCGFLFVAASCLLINNNLARQRQATERIEAQATALLHARDELEIRVQQRTSELSQAGELTRMSEARLGGIVNSAMDAIISVDVEHRIVLFNTTAEKIFHCTAGEAMGQLIDKFIPERFREQHHHHVTGFGKTGKTVRSTKLMSDLRGLRTDGQEFPIEASISHVEFAGQSIFTVILRDITERQRIEQAAVLLALIVQSSSDAIIGKDLNSIVTSWNPAAEQMFGYSADEMVSRPITLIIPPDRLAEEELIQSKIKRGERIEHFETERLRKDGSQIMVSITVSPIKDALGRVIGASKAVRDITERNRAEAALRASEAQLQTIVESLDEAVVVSDIKGKLLHLNRAALEMLGYSSLKEGLRQMADLVDTFELAGMDGAAWTVDQWPLARILRGEKLRDVEARMRRINTEWERVFSFGGNFALDAGGKPLMAVVTFSDITERKQAEEARKASEGRYRTLFDYAPDGIVIANSESYYLDANPKICRMLGYSRDELIGLHASNIVVPSEIEFIGAALNIINSKSDYNREWQFKRKDGSGFSAEVIATLMPDGNLMGMIRDITERKRTEAALREGEERFRTMANSIPQLAWIARPDGSIFWYNDRWYEYTGTTLEQMAGWGWQSVHDPQVLPKVMEGWNTAIESGKPFEMEFPLRGGDGTFRGFLTRVQPLKDSQGQLVQWFGTNTDIETLKQAEEKIRLLNSELEQRVVERTAQLQTANNELEAFSYSVSHDLRAPLRSLDGFSQALLEDCADKLPPESQDYLRRIRSASQRMGQLIDDLLNLSRLTRVEMKRETVDLSKMARATFEELRAPDAQREAEIVVADGLVVDADPRLIQVVMTNLLGNAWKFTAKRPHARIEFGCAGENGSKEFFVRDNGVGFDMAYAEKLFGAFQRLHAMHEFPGTGIGLALVQRIINRHGGRVWADSAIDAGATFHFTLTTA